MTVRIDPRIVRTAQACEQAIVELASQRPVSQISVAELAERAGVTRATFYNRYSSPLELLIQVLFADLERAHRFEEARSSRRRLLASPTVAPYDRRGRRSHRAVHGRIPARRA